MKVLSVNQMQKLKELSDLYGVPIDTDKASMAFWNFNIGNDGTNAYDILMENNDFPSNEDWAQYGNKNCCVWLLFKTPVFTSQDIIELLPHEVTDYADYQLLIDKQSDSYSVSYENTDSFLVSFFRVELLDCLYEMLLWVIDNNYLETK